MIDPKHLPPKLAAFRDSLPTGKPRPIPGWFNRIETSVTLYCDEQGRQQAVILWSRLQRLLRELRRRLVRRI